MPRKLKTYRTSVGFFDLAIAAPSMKAAADAWGTKSDVFRRGFAERVDDDPEILAATMAKPGVILKRPVGSSGPFKEKAELPKNLPDRAKRTRQSRSKGRKPPDRKPDPKANRKAALAFEKEQNRREEARKTEEAAREKERRKREQAVAKAERALEAAKRRHDAKAKDIERQRAALEKRSKAEDAHWEKQRKKLEAALSRASD